jgi:hypothetical protein
VSGRIAWLLNFGAEEALLGGSSRSPPDWEGLAARTGLVREGDVLVRSDTSAEEVARCEGRAWVPEGGARRALARLGVSLRPEIADAVLVKVLGRRSQAELGPTLEGERWVERIEDLPRFGTGERWVAKREHSCAGRGRRIWLGEPVEEDRAWIERALAQGGLIVEPWVERSADYGLHGWLGGEALMVGEPTVQRVSERGAWIASERAPAGSLSAGEERALRAELVRAAEWLERAGYRGPFGVDAFRIADGKFRARCEVNARYSMGWVIGMAGRRPDVG